MKKSFSKGRSYYNSESREAGTYQHQLIGLVEARQELDDVDVFLGVIDHPPTALISPAGLDALLGTSGSSRLQPGSGLPAALRHDDKFTTTRPLETRFTTRLDDRLIAAK